MAAVLVAAAVVQAWPAAQAALEFDRSRIAAGQWWRLVTSSFVHFGWANFAANVGAFAALCCLARWRGLRLMPAVAPAAALVGLAVFLWAGGITVYRGLSGVSYALLAVVVLHTALGAGKAAAAGWAGLLAAVAARSALEAAMGRSLLPTSLPAGASVTAVAHLAGMAAGAAVAAGYAMAGRSARTPPTSVC